MIMLDHIRKIMLQMRAVALPFVHEFNYVSDVTIDCEQS